MPVYRLTENPIFPRPSLAEENGLLAIGGDLTPRRLLEAYRLGIFPWYAEGDPILWWFTSPRLVLYPHEIHISKRLMRYMKKPLYRVTMDTVFSQIIKSCKNIRRDKGEETWITEEMQTAYITLHELGFAHSVECWLEDKLVGGLYGVALGKIFFGESMFSSMSNSSKIAFATLVLFLQEKGYKLIDCQMTTDHLLRFGAREISGRNFSTLLSEHISHFKPDGYWKYDSFS